MLGNAGVLWQSNLCVFPSKLNNTVARVAVFHCSWKLVTLTQNIPCEEIFRGVPLCESVNTSTLLQYFPFVLRYWMRSEEVGGSGINTCEYSEAFDWFPRGATSIREEVSQRCQLLLALLITFQFLMYKAAPVSLHLQHVETNSPGRVICDWELITWALQIRDGVPLYHYHSISLAVNLHNRAKWHSIVHQHVIYLFFFLFTAGHFQR